MDSKKIEELLNRYWECETSLEEEQQLREYFQGNSIPEQHKETAALFKYFHENKKKSLSDAAFDSAVLAKVNVKKGKVVSLFYNSMRIAAGIAVLLTATWFVRNEVRQTTPQEIVDTYDDPQLAFEETKKALMMISKGFGQAEQEAKKINLFNEAQEDIQKSAKTESTL
jgi:hypothetical protein